MHFYDYPDPEVKPYVVTIPVSGHLNVVVGAANELEALILADSLPINVTVGAELQRLAKPCSRRLPVPLGNSKGETDMANAIAEPIEEEDMLQ